MKIIAYRKQFLADHSSTNYLFYSPKPLTQKAQTFVNTLSSHVEVSDYTAEITYHGDYADLDNTRKGKFLKHFPVCIRESYDWWDLIIVLEKDKVASLDLEERYEDCGGESSLSFTSQEKSLILWFEGVHIDYSACHDMEELAELGVKIRKEIHRKSVSAIDVMANYCIGEPDIDNIKLSKVAKELFNILDPI